MNILIITNLYPEHEAVSSLTGKSATRVSRAIHYLAKGLSGFDVHVKKVIRPTYEASWRELKFTSKKFRQEQLDGLAVETRSFLNVPKLGSLVRRSDVAYMRESIKGIDLIVSHMPDDTKLAREIYKKFGVPFISALHEFDMRNFERQKKILPDARNVYARSWSIQRRAEEQGVKVDGIVYSGIEEEWIVGKTKFTQNDTIKFITVTPLAKSKNIDTILQVFIQLPKELKCEYTIIGDGDEYDNIKDLIRDLGLEDKVKMLGKKTRDECLEAMKESDVFLMPGYPETFGLAYLEAMASGCIVVCAKGAGVDGLIEHEKNGYLVAPRSVEELQEVMERVYHKPQHEILANSFETIKQYTLKKAQENYADIIKRNLRQ